MLATSEKAKLEKSFPVMLGSLADRAVQKKKRLFFLLFFFLLFFNFRSYGLYT